MMEPKFVGLVVGWYCCSIGLSVYNRWMFDPHQGLYIPFPILITAFHQIMLWILSTLYLYIISVDFSQLKVKWKFYCKYLIPTALTSAGDIGLSNASLKYIPLTIYIVVKSSSIAFVLLFGCIFKVEKFHWRLFFIVLVMSVGVSLMMYRPVDTSQNEILLGSILVLVSACFSGLRWIYTQLILRKVLDPQELAKPVEQDATSTKSNGMTPMNTIRLLSPLMSLSLFIASLLVERPFPEIFNSSLFRFKDSPITFLALLRGFGLMMVPVILVFLFTLCEFYILKIASVLTMCVTGIFKEILTIIFGVLLLNETLGGIFNIVGMAIVLSDTIYYNYFRYQQQKESDEIKEQLNDDYVLLLADNPVDVKIMYSNKNAETY